MQEELQTKAPCVAAASTGAAAAANSFSNSRRRSSQGASLAPKRSAMRRPGGISPLLDAGGPLLRELTPDLCTSRFPLALCLSICIDRQTCLIER